jgi:peptidoglycan hydrolase-like protein with peptidoglycan-binding domain
VDSQVLAAQGWLNDTYGAFAGWVPLVEDGITGWATIYGLRRGLQVELGVSPLSSAFGPATTSAFVSQVGRIDSRTTHPNLLRILSASLWCKGYPGLYDRDSPTFDDMSSSVSFVRSDLGLGPEDPHVDVKLMTSLLSMDAYVLVRGGRSSVREVQQWLNATYSARRDFALVPCDGVFSRQIQRALLFALQYEMGMADGTANGNFGPGTRDGLRSQAQVGLGSVDLTRRFVRLYQASLRFNTYDVPFNGAFGAETENVTRGFQSFMELPESGRGDYSTWCALLVSNGDTTIATSGFDTNRQLTPAEARGAVASGYVTVGRYIVGANKFITAEELVGLRAAGLRLQPIHQRFNNSPELMTRANGKKHGIEAIERCRVLGLPDDAGIVFAVDFDALGETIEGPVCDYFRGIEDAMDRSLSTDYKVLVYGTRNVASVVIERGLATGAFVAGMSSGWSGNMGFPMPQDWRYNQIVETSVQFPGSLRTIAIDKVVVSRTARPVDLSDVVAPPVERDGSSSATGFDVFFEWLVRAESACERGLSEAHHWYRPLKHYQVFVPFYIAHWLQKPKYWSDNDGGLWPSYTPVVHADEDARLAHMAAEEALEALIPNKPDSTRDIAHFAATLRGYAEWGVPTTRDDYGIGDLGGWALDLLQLWGSYERASATDPSINQFLWMRERVGVEGSEGGFDWADVVADADAWLMQKASEAEENTYLSVVARPLLQLTSRQRAGRFYQDRFGGSEGNLREAFAKLADGIDAGPVDNVWGSKQALLQAAGASRLPNDDEAKICASAYAQFLASLG